MKKSEETPSKNQEMTADETLREGVDYTIENGLFVFTRDYLLRRGYCCGSGCRNCPYKSESK